MLIATSKGRARKGSLGVPAAALLSYPECPHSLWAARNGIPKELFHEHAFVSESPLSRNKQGIRPIGESFVGTEHLPWFLDFKPHAMSCSLSGMGLPCRPGGHGSVATGGASA